MKKTLALLLSLLLFATSCAVPGIRKIVPETGMTDTDPETETETEETYICIDPPVPDANGEDGKPTLDLYTPTSYEEVYEKVRTLAERNYSGTTYYYDEREAVLEDGIEMEMPATAAVEPSSLDSAKSAAPIKGDYSKTNAQVAGIDEGDIVKTDGDYIYILRNGRDLVILSADGADTDVLSMTQVVINEEYHYDDYKEKSGGYESSSKSQYATEMYVENGVAAVISNYNSWHEIYKDGVWSNDNENYIALDLYDVSDPYAPVKIDSFGQDGTYSSSRLMNGELYLITRYYVYSWNSDGVVYDDYIPHLYRSGEPELMPVDCIVCPEELTNETYTVISRYSLENGEREASRTILGAGDTLYMNGEHLYLAGSRYVTDPVEVTEESVYTVTHYQNGSRTDIYKLDVSGDMEVTAVGTLDGTLLNQFAMDEYNGFLRVVSTVAKNSYTVYEDEEYGFTNYRYDDADDYNELTVFDEDMEIVGRITGLGEDERVYSVRFTGDVGYFVTFRQVDPLFSVDLSDPYHPTVMGELKMPGFSNYLHPYSETLLFGLGQDADEETGRTNGMKLSMFDVSDPYDVIERDKTAVDATYSTALYNHKAILIAPEHSLIGFPSENGYVIYRYTEEDGFTLQNEIDFTDDDGYWWYGETRGLYVDDNIYIVAADKTVVIDMESGMIIGRVSY